MQIISKGFIIGIYVGCWMIESEVIVENVTLFNVHIKFAASVLHSFVRKLITLLGVR